MNTIPPYNQAFHDDRSTSQVVLFVYFMESKLKKVSSSSEVILVEKKKKKLTFGNQTWKCVSFVQQH